MKTLIDDYREIIRKNGYNVDDFDIKKSIIVDPPNIMKITVINTKNNKKKLI